MYDAKYDPSRRNFLRNLGTIGAGTALGLGLTSGGCASLESMLKPDYYPKEGEPHTLVFDINGAKVVAYDLRGPWEVESKYMRKGKAIIDIVQEGNKFDVIMAEDYDTDLTKGKQVAEGIVKGNAVVCIAMTTRAAYLITKIPQGVNSLECPSVFRHGDTFTLRRMSR